MGWWKTNYCRELNFWMCAHLFPSRIFLGDYIHGSNILYLCYSKLPRQRHFFSNSSVQRGRRLRPFITTSRQALSQFCSFKTTFLNLNLSINGFWGSNIVKGPIGRGVHSRYGLTLTWSDAHLDHVVLVEGPERRGRGVDGLGPVLEQADRLLPARVERVDRKAEAGRLALGLLPAPALALVQAQVPDGVVGLARVVDVRHLQERSPTWGKREKKNVWN